MITISKEQIQEIVEKLKAADVATCAIAPDKVVEKAVINWLNDHIDSLATDPDWWIRNHSKGLHKYGLPYEDEIAISDEIAA